MKVLLACGGTGGDIFPAVAVAEVLVKKRGDIELVFVGTKKGLEKNILAKTPWRLEMITSATFADKKGLKKLAGLFPFFKALVGAFKIVKRERPHFVLGVGNYVAVPVFLAAFLMGIPALSIEPNAVPGLANRVIRYFVKEVVVAYPGMEKYFGAKTRLFGVPVRERLLQEARAAETSEKKVIFVFGGSLGAKRINEGILAALPFLEDWKNRLHFVHQIGTQWDLEKTKAVYKDRRFSAEVYPFIDAMGTFYGKAHLVVARAGGNTIAELIALKKPAILIPYPFARGGHQEINARALEKLGGAKVLLDPEATGEQLATLIKDCLQRSWTSLAPEAGGAADKVAEEVLKLSAHV